MVTSRFQYLYTAWWEDVDIYEKETNASTWWGLLLPSWCLQVTGSRFGCQSEWSQTLLLPKKQKKKRQKTKSWPVIIVATDLIPTLWHAVTAGGSDKTIQMAEGLGTYICIYERPQHGRLDHLLKPKSARLLCRRFGLHGETGVHWVSSIKHWTGPVKEAVPLETKNNNSSELNMSQGACTSMMSRSVSQQSCCGCQPSRGDVNHCCLFFFFS